LQFIFLTLGIGNRSIILEEGAFNELVKTEEKKRIKKLESYASIKKIMRNEGIEESQLIEAVEKAIEEENKRVERFFDKKE